MDRTLIGLFFAAVLAAQVPAPAPVPQSGGGSGGTCASLGGDVTGSCAANTVGKINGTALSGLATGILKNTTTTGVPSIAASGTDYVVPLTCTAPQFLIATGTCATPVLTQNSQSAAYTTVLADAGKMILHPSSDNSARTFTIDSNANVAYVTGTCITFVNMISTVTIAITSDTMTLMGANTTGSRTLAVGNWATACKIAATSWVIGGSSGLT